MNVTPSTNVDVLRSRPHSITIGVTGKCNLRCCYCHKSDEVFEALPGSNADLADNAIDRIYRYCKDAGVKHVTLSAGGETTMFSGWHRRLALFVDDTDIEAHIVSNFARVFSDDDLNALAKFNAIQISFDSADTQTVRKLRSKADLRTITFNIINLRQRAREQRRKQTLVVNCTLWRDNIGGIAKLAGFCRELGVDQLLLTEGFVSTAHNYTVPNTLGTLTDEDVLLFAQQLIAAEDALADSRTSLRLQDHLRVRISDVLEDVRKGVKPHSATSSFNRPRTVSACRQPWQAPLVTPEGKILPCCVAGDMAIGDLSSGATMAEILDSDAARAVRASILEGKPTLPCENCSFASDLPLVEFIQDILEWQGGVAAPRESDVQTSVWPDLLGIAQHPVTVENAGLAHSEGIASLNETASHGLHRVLLDSCDHSEIAFRIRPKGRRRIRLDLAAGHVMVGRAHLAAARIPTAEIEMGELSYRFASLPDGWLQVIVQSPKAFSHVNITLMRDDNAVSYRGDGRSAMEIADLRAS